MHTSKKILAAAFYDLQTVGPEILGCEEHSIYTKENASNTEGQPLEKKKLGVQDEALYQKTTFHEAQQGPTVYPRPPVFYQEIALWTEGQQITKTQEAAVKCGIQIQESAFIVKHSNQDILKERTPEVSLENRTFE